MCSLCIPDDAVSEPSAGYSTIPLPRNAFPDDVWRARLMKTKWPHRHCSVVECQPMN